MTLWRSNARPPTEVALVKVAGGGGGGGGFVDALLKPFHISPKVIKKDKSGVFQSGIVW